MLSNPVKYAILGLGKFLSIGYIKAIMKVEEWCGVNQKAIETKAVDAVRDIIVESDYLDQFISDNDKEPSWDGFVYVYSNKNKKKSNLIGRVSVQVKGTQRKIAKNTPYIKDSVSTADLRNYLNEGGAFYFVVHISIDGKEKRIFYEDLLPVKIMRILSNVKNQTTVTLKFKPFPTDIPLITGLFNSFLQHKKKQVILNDLKEIPRIEDLQKSGVLNQITFTTAGSQKYKDPIEAVLNDEVYVYATLVGSDAHHPVDLLDGKFERVVSYNIDTSISVNGISYYDKYTINRTANDVSLKLGKSVTITFPYPLKSFADGKTKINYTPADSLRERIIDFKFWIEAVKSESIEFNRTAFQFSLDCKPSVNAWEDEFNFWNKAVQVLDILNISDDISIKSLSEFDYRELQTLINVFVNKQPVNLRKDLPFNYVLSLCGLKIALIHMKSENDENNSTIEDYFSNNFVFGYTLKDDPKKFEHFIPPFAVLDNDAWGTISNINFEDIVPSFEKLLEKHNDSNLFYVANDTLLAMLLAYDKTRKKQLLEASIQLSIWVKDNCPSEVLCGNTRLINSLQSYKRIRNLDESERILLYVIADDSSLDSQIRIGAFLLLGNQDVAKFHFEKLDALIKSDFIERPIYHFMDSTQINESK